MVLEPIVTKKGKLVYPVYIKFSEKDYNMLSSFAEKHNIACTEVIRRALRIYCNSNAYSKSRLFELMAYEELISRIVDNE